MHHLQYSLFAVIILLKREASPSEFISFIIGIAMEFVDTWRQLSWACWDNTYSMKYSLMKVLIILPNTTFSYVAFRHSCHCSYKILLSFCGSLHVTFCLALSLISFTYKCGHVLSYFCYFLMLEMDKINGKHAFIGKINEIYTYTVIFFFYSVICILLTKMSTW